MALESLNHLSFLNIPDSHYTIRVACYDLLSINRPFSTKNPLSFVFIISVFQIYGEPSMNALPDLDHSIVTSGEKLLFLRIVPYNVDLHIMSGYHITRTFAISKFPSLDSFIKSHRCELSPVISGPIEALDGKRVALEFVGLFILL
mmetsp:Transcript_27853/g.24486  ORF Transcript_27853/g.24486 Transcript_27853/m.24486 type:complete len:146 (+) Transcript_27853:1866-2303(+)